MEYHVYWLLKSSCFELSGDENAGDFWAKKLIERWNLLIIEKFCFWTFWRLDLLLSQKVDGKIVFTDYWKFLVLNFLEMGNMILFGAKKFMKRWYLLGLFELYVIFQYNFLCSRWVIYQNQHFLIILIVDSKVFLKTICLCWKF